MSIQIDFEKGKGLIPVVVQDYSSGDVLMVAYMNQEAWEATLSTGRAHYFSRSRNTLWQKGEESGNVQVVKEIRVDCDRDTVLLLVEQIGEAACHMGYRSCFYRCVWREGQGEVEEICERRVFDPEEVYNR